MARFFIIGVVFWFLFRPVIGLSQWRPYNFRQIQVENESLTNIHCMAQDSIGFLYFGTNNGLVRFDGENYKHFTHIPGDTTTIGPGDVWSIHLDLKNQLWLGLRFGGLCVYDPSTGQFDQIKLPETDQNLLPSVYAIEEDENYIWAGGLFGKLHRFDKYTRHFLSFSPEWLQIPELKMSHSIVSIVQDVQDADILWLTLMNYSFPETKFKQLLALVEFNKSNGKFLRHPVDFNVEFQDEQGHLWGRSTQGRLFKYDPDFRKVEFYQHPAYREDEFTTTINDIHDMGDHILLVSDEFIVTFSKSDHLFKPLFHAKSVGTLRTIFEDRYGNIWFGGKTGYIYIDRKKQDIKFYSFDSLGYTIRIYPGKLSFNAKDSSLYVTNFTNQLYQIPLDPSQKAVKWSFSNRLNGVLAKGDGSTLINHEGDLMEFIPKYDQAKFMQCGEETAIGMYKMLRNKDGIIGGISAMSFSSFTEDGRVLQKLNIEDLPARQSNAKHFEDISVCRNGNFLVYSNQIYAINPESGAVTLYALDKQFNQHGLEIRSIVEDSEDLLWISLPNMIGCFRLENDSLHLHRSFTTLDGLMNQWYDQLYCDSSGRIWAFSVNGIDAIDPVSRAIRHFGVIDGLPSIINDVSQICEISDGRIASTCSNGIIVIHTDSLWTHSAIKPSKIIVKQILIDGKALNSNDPNTIEELELSANQRVLNVEFQALDLINSKAQTYAYRLKGKTMEWTSIGATKQISFQGLSPGRYTLQIRTWLSETQTPLYELNIHKARPFFLHYWFLGLLILAFGTGVYAYNNWRVRKIEQKEQEKTNRALERAELELKALRAQMNPHFMFNSLNAIKNYILQAEAVKAAEYLSNFAHLIRMILQNSREQFVPLSDILDSLRLYVELEQIRLENHFELHCEIAENLELNKIMIPSMILQPFLENAIWHGLRHKEGKGNLWFKIYREEAEMVFVIEDDGIGREASLALSQTSMRKYKSMGLSITSERIALLNQVHAMSIKLDILDKMDENGKGMGTKVIMRLPIKMETQ